MKKLFKISIMIIIFILVIAIPYANFASIPSILEDDFADEFNPDAEEESSAVENMTTPVTNVIVEIVRKVVGVIQIIGGFLTIISIALFGLGMLLGSQRGISDALGMDTKGGGAYGPGARKLLMDLLTNLLIGSVLLFASSSIVVFFMGAVFY